MKRYGIRIVVLIIFFLQFSCVLKKRGTNREYKVKNAIRTVTIAEVFGKTVIVDSLGVTGADGVISFPLNDTTSVFMMGDSFLNSVQNKKRNIKSKMINNTFILVNADKNSHTALYQGTIDNPDTMLKPIYGNPKEYYWPGHGFEKNGVLHVFMSRFLHVDYDWGFAYSGTDYIRMDKNSFEIVSQEDFPYSNQNNVHYGHSIINEKDFTYLYGSWSDKNSTGLHVARAKLDVEDNKLRSYEFYDDDTWVLDPLLSKPLKGISKNVPEQFSVFKYGKLYVLILQERSLISGNIYSYIADSPVGPWRNEKLLYHTTEQEIHAEDKVFTYNAMAHPQYIRDDKLLVSYCINSFDVPKIHEVNTDYYRPKFLWVPMELILK